MGRPEKGDAYDFFSTHPRTADRVREAVQQASGTTVADPMRARDIYLSKIDGMLYGSDPKEGVVRGRDFLHPELRFAFRVPPGYRIVNTPSRVVAFGPSNARLFFDVADKPADGPMVYYLTEVWLPGTDLKDVERLSINGLDAATGRTTVRTNEGEFDARAVAIRKDVQTIYRFVFLTPPSLVGNLSEELRRTTYSFRLLSAAEAAEIKPLRLKIVRAAAGDTVTSLARRMPFEEFAEERFRVLNGLMPGQEVTPGQQVKIVVE
jgi:predicted Zn-dependent protease